MAVFASSLMVAGTEGLAQPSDEAVVCRPRQIRAECPSIRLSKIAGILADDLMGSFHLSRSALGRGNARSRVVFSAASAHADKGPTWLGFEVVKELDTKIRNQLRADIGRRHLTSQQIKNLKALHWSAKDIRELEKSTQEWLKDELERADLWRTKAAAIVRSPTTWIKTDDGWEFSNDLYLSMRTYWRQENY